MSPKPRRAPIGSEPSLEVSLRRSFNRTAVRLFWKLLGGVALLDSLLFLASTSRVNHRTEADKSAHSR